MHVAGMTGKTVLVTGATSGIGEATARALAADGAQVLVHGRNRAKGATVVEKIKTGNPGAAVEFVEADFAELASVRALAAEVLKRTPRLDVLINNAGGTYAKRELTADGFEMTFGTNHLAHFLLTNLLLDRIKASAPARIVNVSSAGHRLGRIDFDDLQGAHGYSFVQAYGQSKLANILFTRALARRLEGTSVTANALHPGAVRTGLGMNNTGPMTIIIKLGQGFILPPAKGARTSIYLASSPEVERVTGAYFANCKEVKPSAAALDDAVAERLWRVSAELTALKG